MILFYLPHLLLLFTAFPGKCTAVRKSASRNLVIIFRYDSRNRCKRPSALIVNARNRIKQCFRIRMCRMIKRSFTDAISMICPAYMTNTRSAICATSPISCVIRITDIPISFCRSRINSMICAWIVTSSAVVGSSAIKSFGLQQSAIAIITR